MRKTGFYPKLAAQNIRKNRRFYLPYLLTVLGTVAAFYIMSALVFDPGTDNLAPGTVSGAEYAKVFMSIGMVVAGLFSVIFLLYTNSFLMKRRQKELGLYSVLGMGKRNIAGVLCFESLYIALIGVGGGMGVGILLHKLVTLLLYKLIRVPAPFGFAVSIKGLAITALLFCGLVLLTLLFNLVRVGRTRPVELLHGGEVGEKEPKTRWVMTILGVLSLGFAYWLALKVSNGVEALGYYFLAAAAVILGTYFLFVAVSVFVLKMLRKNKRFYYKTSHFIGVSGMLYRMKQNAVGLANICILSTMVMVMVSGTLSLYLGTEDSIDRLFPEDMTAVVRYDPEKEQPFDSAAMLTQLDARLEDMGLDANLVSTGRHLPIGVGLLGDGSLTLDAENPDVQKILALSILTAEDYAALTGTAPLVLQPGEVLLGDENRVIAGDSLRLELGAESLEYKIIRRLEKSPQVGYDVSAGTVNCHMIVADEAELLRLFRLQKAAYGSQASTLYWEARYDLGCTEEEMMDLESRFWDEGGSLGDSGSWEAFYINSRAEYALAAFSLAGGFLFLGVFLGLIFLMATVLIIYYKQVSEGYEDRRRFQIMRQVGLSAQEARRAIRSQIRTVFFLPILVAAVHMIFDFNMVRQLLSLFSLTNANLTILCTAGTVLVFFAVYAVVYGLTARTYYKIIS